MLIYSQSFVISIFLTKNKKNLNIYIHIFVWLVLPLEPGLIRDPAPGLWLSGAQSAASRTRQSESKVWGCQGQGSPWNRPESEEENYNYRLKVWPLTLSVSLSCYVGGFQGSGGVGGWGGDCCSGSCKDLMSPPPPNPEQSVLLLHRCSSLYKQFYFLEGGVRGLGFGVGGGRGHSQTCNTQKQTSG